MIESSPMVENAKTAGLSLGAGCNNSCVFCFGSEKNSGPFTCVLEKAAAALKQHQAAGVDRLVIGGGEPTLCENLGAVLRLAGAMDFEHVQLRTNGRLLADPARCRAVVEGEVDEYAVSVHGAVAAAHDFLTQSPGSLIQTLAGIQNLKKLGQRVAVCVRVVKSNYRNLPEIVQLAAALKGDRCEFTFVDASDKIGDEQDWLIAKQEMAGPWIKKAVLAGRRLGLPMTVSGVPPCVLGGESWTRQVCAFPGPVRFNAGAPCFPGQSPAAKGPKCDSCRLFDSCAGPSLAYTGRYGWSEFKPLPAH
ncbi:MAG: radical SAM protein [Elusimicrobia bacterium]|nr:radical SAM protein [Elusimicrobiota bacterium]